MYAVVAQRTREIATLRALGFSRLAILFSFVIESMFIALVGWRLGVQPRRWPPTLFPVGGHGQRDVLGARLRLPRHARRRSPADVFALVMGFVGGLLPAVRAARMPCGRCARPDVGTRDAGERAGRPRPGASDMRSSPGSQSLEAGSISAALKGRPTGPGPPVGRGFSPAETPLAPPRTEETRAPPPRPTASAVLDCTRHTDLTLRASGARRGLDRRVAPHRSFRSTPNCPP